MFGRNRLCGWSHEYSTMRCNSWYDVFVVPVTPVMPPICLFTVAPWVPLQDRGTVPYSQVMVSGPVLWEAEDGRAPDGSAAARYVVWMEWRGGRSPTLSRLGLPTRLSSRCAKDYPAPLSCWLHSDLTVTTALPLSLTTTHRLAFRPSEATSRL